MKTTFRSRHLLIVLLALAPTWSQAARPGGSAPPPPTYPPARYWHTFAATGAEDASSKLYMFGGAAGAPSYTLLNDLWAYTGAGSTSAAWTLAATGSTKPPGLQHVAWACSTSECLAASGSNGVTVRKLTWLYDFVPQRWVSLNCKRYVCPSGRSAASLGYDPTTRTYVLFGGTVDVATLADTYTFDPVQMRWTALGTDLGASARRSAGMTFASGSIGRIVMHGGQVDGQLVLDDLYTWDGTRWQPVTQSGGPALHSHAIAWDSTSGRLVVTGGSIDVTDTPNTDVWYFTFTSATAGEWQKGAALACQSSLSADPEIHPGAKMARDAATGTLVFFGGTSEVGGTLAVGNTVDCH